MILETNQMIVYETGSASRKSEFMECEDESYFVNSLQVELDNLHETQKNSQKIYKKLPCEKSACSISYALKYLYQHQMDILN